MNPITYTWSTKPLNENTHTLTCGGADTLDEALVKAQGMVDYYRKECGYKTIKVCVESTCATCFGARRVRKARSRMMTMVKCPACKGQDVDAVVHEEVVS
jgi:hypothetical protein